MEKNVLISDAYWEKKMELLCAVEVIENTNSKGADKLEILADLLDWGQRLFFIIPVVLLIALFIATLLCFRMRCKKITIELVEKYSATGKFIKGLFVELNNSKEYIRAFCFSKLWKQKVIRNYNMLFNDKMGKELPQVYSESRIRLRLSAKTNVKDVKSEMEKTKRFLEKMNKGELVCNPDYKNTNMLYECFGSGYSRSIDNIEKMASYLDSECLVVTGTAGNGKSMMLCSVADFLARKKETVLFLNARDIKENLISYLAKNVMSEKLRRVFTIWWNLQGITHSIVNKDIYILIDAINENDNIEFLESLSDSIEKLLKIKHVRVILSCRSEYYDLKYKKYLFKESSRFRASFLNLQEEDYSYEARERLITNYACHYKFTGELSEEVKEKITRQLLLVRILFEVYSGKNDYIYELNKYRLYKQYIDGVNNKEIGYLLKQLAEYMFDNRQFENIPLIKLGQLSDKYEMIDSSVLVCRNLIKNKGTLREETEEVINFVYDEMRDYRLSTYLLDICEDETGNVDYFKVKSLLLELREQGAVCVEGIINYIYNHCVVENNTQMLEFLLFDLIMERDNQIDEFRNRRNRHISSWGLTLLFETDSIDSVFGKKYVDYILRENPGKEGQKLLFYLLKQECSNGKNTLDILLNAFLRVSTINDFENVIGNTISSWEGEGITVSDLIKVHEKIIQANKEGADRFLIYASLITMCYNWNGKYDTQEYIKRISNHMMIDEYINKLEECIY